MNREEHRRRAEALLENAWKRSASDGETLIQTPSRRAELIATAHVHALLSLPAALSGEAQEGAQ